jgi:cytochrome c
MVRRRFGLLSFVGASATAVALLFSASVFADVDAVAAKKLARKDHCLRCHDVEKKKEGPSYRSIANKYKDQPEAAEKLYQHITSGKDRVKLSDGHEEDHKTDLKTSEAELRNLIAWILAQ